MSLSEPGSRKRYRSNYDDEISEFTPLSKRINNLHINNAVLPVQKQTEQHDSRGVLHKNIIESNARLSEVHCGGSRNIDSHEASDHWTSQHYSPDLTPSENPFYYESNRLLFELYMERVQRLGLSNTQYL